MNCQSCQRVNEAHRRYCGGCGARLTVTCERCAFVNSLADSFCGGCANRLVVAAPKLELVKEPAVIVRRQEAGFSDLSDAEMSELLAVKRHQFDTTLPSKVSQDDLDKLFGKS